MSVNVYLSDKIREHSEFKSRPYQGSDQMKLTFGSLDVFSNRGRLHLIWSESEPIPANLNDLVEEISWYESIPQMSHRESGVYRLNTAECELTPGDAGNSKREKPVYWLKIKAKNLEDIHALLHKVKTGTIRPDESYECAQLGKSREQLEAELAQAVMQLRVVVEPTLLKLSRLSDKITRFKSFATTLQNKPLWLPLVFRKTVAAQISAIINEKD